MKPTSLLLLLLSIPIAAAQELPTKGSFVILDNDELIEGDISRTGDVCRIRRGSGETALPISRVRFILDSRPEALAAMRKGMQLNNSLDHYRLAVWCYRQGMIPDAIASAEQAVRISPNNPTFSRYVQAMKELAARPSRSPIAPASTTNREPIAVPPEDFVGEAWPMFVQKIQPILLNTCLECHNAEKGGAFQLERTTAANRRGSMNNLVATLGQIDRRKPEASALVVKSISAHGGSTLPPIRTWQPTVAKTLEEWTLGAVRPSANPKATDSIGAIGASGVSTPMPTLPGAVSTPPGAKDIPDLFPDSPKSVPFAADSKSQVEPAKKPEAIDPFDPDIFHGKVAPKK